MDLNQLRAFVSVVQSGSFTRAAELLRSQKARVSKQISELERAFGVRLLERSTRSLRTTEVGREIYERSVGILAAVEDAERVAQAVHGQPHGQLRITMPLEFGLLIGFDWVRAVLQAHPQLMIEVESSSRIVDLVHEGFDLAIRVGPLADSRLAARKLGDLHYGLYAAPSYLQRRGTPTHAAELAQHDLILFAPGGKPAPFRLQNSAGNIDLSTIIPRLRVDSRYAQHRAALAGLGIVENLCLIAEPEVTAGTLQRVLPDTQPPPVPVHAIFPSHRFLTPKVRAFVEYARGNFPQTRAEVRV
jgi:LysR family transcriptional regulator, regulator for bpeEF and oprC